MACEPCKSQNSHAYSPCAKLSDSMALIRVDNSNPCTTLAEAFPHAGMKSFIHAGVGTQFLPNLFPCGIAKAYDDPVTQKTLFRGTQTLMDYLFDKFRFASQLVVSASNAELERGEMPEGIPKDILNTELSMPIDIALLGYPHVILADPSMPNFFRMVGFDTPAGVFHFCQNLEKLFSKVTQWLHGRVRLSIAKGLHSQVNWGSFLDITHCDFLDMVAPGMADITGPAPERDVAMRNPEDDDFVMDEADNTLALIFHLLECNTISAGLLLPYDPTSPDFDINYYTPSAYITNCDKDVYKLLDYLVMDIKGAFAI
ncbi:hypothetical protein PM082_016824 [Marasmius tenuissimus]|nr:hypothetical protein PM082_016824 [Marasmius tenuissimus]